MPTTSRGSKAIWRHAFPRVPNLAAFGATTALWPFLLFGHEVCAP